MLTSASKAAMRIVDSCERAVGMETSGQFLHYDGSQLPW